MVTDHSYAESVYINGYIYTADSKNTVCEAIAIADGYIIACGSTSQIKSLVNQDTDIIDLQGKTMLPGIIDAHLHPFWGGMQLSGCHLDYASLTVEDTLTKIQNYLDRDPCNSSNDWLQVRGWLRQEVLPLGTDITRADLDRLQTARPVILFSNDCHTLVANTRALEKFALDRNTPEPKDGKIGRTADGELNGILEDAPAMRAFDSIPALNDKQAIEVAKLVQHELNKQGVTTAMDARAAELQFNAFKALSHQDNLTIRLFGAAEITPDDAITPSDIVKSIHKVKLFAESYSDTKAQPKPGLKISLVKFFVDGVLQAPLMTASLLKPYRINQGSFEQPNFVESNRLGDLYYDNAILAQLIIAASEAGFNPHMHTVADGAIETVLNHIQTMREQYPHLNHIRPSLAHNELAAPHQYKRFTDLNAIATVSFQWAGPTNEMMEQFNLMLGAERYNDLEPCAKFIDAGAKVAFGSDWPIDPLNEWYNFKVAMTRTGYSPVGKKTKRLDSDRNLTITEVLRAATIDAAFMLSQEQYIGSIETGKFADLIIVDKNPFTISADEIEHIKIIKTIVGGKLVYKHE
ncbi:amidohydrolase [Orbus wheelerorum]|uniref:amidohydrolase n=1 Tax=Orbus wheelerorum TaxID=3074111 RepID=UPI00370DD654